MRTDVSWSKVFFWALFALVVDQLTKWYALHALAQVPSQPVIPHVFHFTLVFNTGIAFGLFESHGVLLGLLTAGVMVAGVFVMRQQYPVLPRRLAWPIALLLGGAIGNAIDRCRFGAVVDFFDFRIWPVFNVADSCITVAAVLLAWHMLMEKH